MSFKAEIVGEAATAAKAVRLAGELHAHVIVLDLSLPDVSGKPLYSMLRDQSPLARVIVFTAYDSEGVVRSRGVSRVLPKENVGSLSILLRTRSVGAHR